MAFCSTPDQGSADATASEGMRRALRVLRDPSEGMERAGAGAGPEVTFVGGGLQPSTASLTPPSIAGRMWRAMIDELLK